MQPLSAPGTGAFALLLGMLSHTVGWPVVEGGSVGVVDALAAEIEAAGGHLHTGRWIGDLQELPSSRITLLDLTPRQLLEIAGDRIPARSRRALSPLSLRPRRLQGRLGPEWSCALAGRGLPQDPHAASRRHASRRSPSASRRSPQDATPSAPICIAVQPCVIDPSRAPQGQHTFYAYCHVPAGSSRDVSDRIEAQIERFAPGFRDLVLAKTVTTATEIESHNPNCIGGDINSGAATLAQTLFRPTVSLRPYSTPLPGVYLCSSSTPPGGGVHGMCGAGAAQAALHDLRH